MTKDVTISYAVDKLQDNGYLIEVINGTAISTYSEHTRHELGMLYDELHEDGYVTADKLAARYVEFDKERKAKAHKAPKKFRK